MALAKKIGLSFVLSLLVGVAACAETAEVPPPVTPPPPPPARTADATPPPAATAALKGPAAPRVDTSLIPRDVLFGNPDRASPQLSHDGKQLSFLAPVDGVMNVWVGPADDPSKAKPVTSDKVRGIRQYFWAYTNDHVLYVQDKGGDENWHLYAVDLKKGETKDLTPIDGIAARISGVSQKIPGEVLVGINDRDKKVHDLYRIDIKTGEKKLVFKNEGNYAGFETDDDFKVRLAMRKGPDGGDVFIDPNAKPKEKGKEPEPYLTVPFEDAETTNPVGFDGSGKTLYLLDSRGRNTAALFELDFATKKAKLLVEDAKADVQRFIGHPKTGKLQAAAAVFDKPTWQTIDKSIQPDLELLGKLGDGELRVLSRTLDDKRWLVALVPSDGPVKYYRYDRDKKKTEFLFTNLKALEGKPLSKMHPVVIKSRDGLDLVSYLTLPKASDPEVDGRPDKPLPMVLLVHGGPWARDTWGLNGMHQWLANRGYAVLSVNYRGSTGFGKKFLNAGNNEWAGKMHDDLIDAVKWAVDGKVADGAKVAIMGGSYGGYATLVGLTFTPDQFACGVDIVGPSNLKTLLATIPPYWAPMVATFHKRMGDPGTPEGTKLLEERSPLSHVGKIKKPLLIGQGANDPRVKQAESDQIVKAMQAKNIPVTYVLYPDEGHGFARPENRMSFNAVAETFLAQCLGGPVEPVGDDFKGSSLQVPAGVEQVYGISEALPKK
ncbi:alpha/beta hydrolase family protein [Polyangium fumosum]|uniref:S9 family peptidase n=1 Tax=Polyangium fumosum TaxID=889272 RepID=A0A4U1J9U8_9BACT|nr:S9 family peptidase [Polyangium fumosum]TKD05198.1 S9 family peptidase [Polyangium fumosum]